MLKARAAASLCTPAGTGDFVRNYSFGGLFSYHISPGNQYVRGNAPDRSRIVLLLVDVIDDLDFPQNEKLVRNL